MTNSIPHVIKLGCFIQQCNKFKFDIQDFEDNNNRQHKKQQIQTRRHDTINRKYVDTLLLRFHEAFIHLTSYRSLITHQISISYLHRSYLQLVTSTVKLLIDARVSNIHAGRGF